MSTNENLLNYNKSDDEINEQYQISKNNPSKDKKVPIISKLSKKIIIIGDGGVGKTTLLNRYVNGKYQNQTKMTIGSDFFIKKLKIKKENAIYEMKLLLWDFAGEERFRFMLQDYAKGSDGIIMAFDISRLNSLYHLINWMEVLKKIREKDEKVKNAQIFLVGTKNDLANKTVLDNTFIHDFMLDFGINYFIKVSSKTSENINKLFKDIASTLIL